MKIRDSLTKGGLAGAACVACCAPPLILALGLTAGLAATAAVFLGLAAAITVVLIGGGAVVARRRSHQPPPVDAPVAVSIGPRPEPAPGSHNAT